MGGNARGVARIARDFLPASRFPAENTRERGARLGRRSRLVPGDYLTIIEMVDRILSLANAKKRSEPIKIAEPNVPDLTLKSCRQQSHTTSSDLMSSVNESMEQ